MQTTDEEYTEMPHDDIHERQQHLGGDPGDGVRGETALWRAVIMQALTDSVSNSKKRQMRYVKAQAISWLSSSTEDFNTVCSLAGMDAARVKKQSKEAMARGCVWKNMKHEMHKPEQKKKPSFDVLNQKPIVPENAAPKEGGKAEVILFKKEVG